MTALLLGWCGKGSLADLLAAPEKNLEWRGTLLRLATDIARGMRYLHSRKFIVDHGHHQDGEGSGNGEEEDGEEFSSCVLHRDLKPDNVLMTDFLAAAITDFGTSRSKAGDSVLMTGVGTPLFAAPEIMLSEVYDEKVDVYSFGLVLLSLAVDTDLPTFFSERYAAAFRKKKPPKQMMRVLRPVWEAGWRPYLPGTGIDAGKEAGDEAGNAAMKAVHDKRSGDGAEKEKQSGTQRQEQELDDEEAGADDPLWFVPSTVKSLIVRCGSHDPSSRPSFDEIMGELDGVVLQELQAAGRVHRPFKRHPPAEPTGDSAVVVANAPQPPPKEVEQQQQQQQQKKKKTYSLHRRSGGTTEKGGVDGRLRGGVARSDGAVIARTSSSALAGRMLGSRRMQPRGSAIPMMESSFGEPEDVHISTLNPMASARTMSIKDEHTTRL